MRNDMMTRRQLLGIVGALSAPGDEIVVPLRLLVDRKVKWSPEQVESFRKDLWAQAVGNLLSCGVRLQVVEGKGEVERPPEREPVISGLEWGSLNFVATNRIPMHWDGGRSLCGVTTLYRGHHLCMVALDLAHGNRVPFVAVNTCLHELLHALLNDIFEDRPSGAKGQMREARVEYVATKLWLFGDGREIREGARSYVQRLADQRRRMSASG